MRGKHSVACGTVWFGWNRRSPCAVETVARTPRSTERRQVISRKRSAAGWRGVARTRQAAQGDAEGGSAAGYAARLPVNPLPNALHATEPLPVVDPSCVVLLYCFPNS